jgi:signal transduction histidine kinase
MTTRQAGGIALVLIVISVFLLVVFRSIELIEERASLFELRELQDNPVRETARVKLQFDALAGGVAELAASGDTGAKTVLDEMRRQGVQLPAAKR